MNEPSNEAEIVNPDAPPVVEPTESVTIEAPASAFGMANLLRNLRVTMNEIAVNGKRVKVAGVVLSRHSQAQIEAAEQRRQDRNRKRSPKPTKRETHNERHGCGGRCEAREIP